MFIRSDLSNSLTLGLSKIGLKPKSLLRTVEFYRTTQVLIKAASEIKNGWISELTENIITYKRALFGTDSLTVRIVIEKFLQLFLFIQM